MKADAVFARTSILTRQILQERKVIRKKNVEKSTKFTVQYMFSASLVSFKITEHKRTIFQDLI
jgi:hypothetical protein